MRKIFGLALVEFQPAGPATSNILFPNCNFALLTTKSSFEAELNQ